MVIVADFYIMDTLVKVVKEIDRLETRLPSEDAELLNIKVESSL